MAGRIRCERRHNRVADDGDVQQVDIKHLLDGKITSRRRMPLEERAAVFIQRVPACLATCLAQGILIRSRGSRPPGGALGRFGEVAALRRGSGTKAASLLAPGRCWRHRIVTHRELGRAVGHCTEDRPEQDE